jgi:hypothetical protein
VFEEGDRIAGGWLLRTDHGDESNHPGNRAKDTLATLARRWKEDYNSGYSWRLLGA